MRLSKVQQEFINLLQTTDQPQGKGALCSADGFCCLGIWTAHRGHRVTSFSCAAGLERFDNGQNVALSDKLTDELGLRSNIGKSASYDSRSLTELNDGGLSFKEIADAILENPDEYFEQQ